MIASAVRMNDRNPVKRLKPGSSAARLMGLLDRPRRGAELPALLGVTRQRVQQLIAVLSARDLIRSADARCPSFVIARKEDASTLLSRDQARVLSAFPEGEATTLSRIALVIRMNNGTIAMTMESLRQACLIEKIGTATDGDLYRLSVTGSAHWQRSARARRAAIPRPPFRSDRILDVLSLLASQGPTRTRDIGRRLGIQQALINSRMQYLKRKNAVRTQTDARYAPYELTPDGRDMLAAMQPTTTDATAT